MPDARHPIPVIAGASGKDEWGTGSDHEQPSLRVEHVREREQVLFAGAPAVVEDEQTLSVTARGALGNEKRGHQPARLSANGAYTEPMASLAPILKKIPAAKLIVVAELLMLARQHMLKLEPQERRRIVELVRRGHGRPSHLSERERRELVRLLEKIEPREFVRTAMRQAGVPVPRSGSSRKPS